MGTEPGLAGVEFQGAGISHHSALVKAHIKCLKKPRASPVNSPAHVASLAGVQRIAARSAARGRQQAGGPFSVLDTQTRRLQPFYFHLRRLSLIQGPPGAGKTTTALLLVRGWTAARRGPILCCADSNIADTRREKANSKAGMQACRYR